MTCERFHAGIPNPDGPGEWLHVFGKVTNTGESDIDLSSRATPLGVEILDVDGNAVMVVEPVPASTDLASGETVWFGIEPINDWHPFADSCRLSFNLAEKYGNPVITGEIRVNVEIFAAP